MIGKTRDIWLFAAKATLFFAVLAVFFVGQYLFYEDTIFFYWGNYIVLMIYAASIYFISKVYNAFSFGSAAVQELMLSWAICLLIANTIQYFMLSLIAEDLLPVEGFMFILAAQIALAIPMTFLIDKLHYNLNPAHKAIIIYGNEKKAYEYRKIIEKHRKKFVISKTISQTTPITELSQYITKSESVFFIDVDDRNMDPLLEYCFKTNKRIYILPTFSGVLINTAGVSWISNRPMFLPKDPEPDMGSRAVKRIMDVTLSLIAIIAFSWLMLIIWAVVRLYDRHPAVYKQVRVTRGGKHFTLYKFRSMHPNAEDDGIPRLMEKGDERVTPIGRFIRKTRMDEFPQLFNVLFGSMSLVGPRPERPELVEKYQELYPNFAFRTKVKAGMTGFAQIYGMYNTEPDVKLFLDIMYIEKFSILEDIKLMLQTIKIIFIPTSTEGVTKD